MKKEELKASAIDQKGIKIFKINRYLVTYAISGKSSIAVALRHERMSFHYTVRNQTNPKEALKAINYTDALHVYNEYKSFLK